MKKNDVLDMIKILKQMYPDAKCSLDFSTPFELLVAVVLSAQCTDNRVNLTTPTLFAKYSTPKDFADMDIHVLEDYIHPCGFYKNKAKNIKATAQILVEKYNGVVPDNMEELISLPGVGRKSANVIMLSANLRALQLILIVSVFLIGLVFLKKVTLLKSRWIY
mgnify:CR=1 FL=1